MAQVVPQVHGAGLGWGGGGEGVSTDLKALMRHHQIVLAICNDPDLSHDAAAFAIYTTAIIYEAKTSATGKLKAQRWLQAVAEMAARGRRHEWMGAHWVRKVISDDIPRYEPPWPGDRSCTAPMVRREGLCGKGGSYSGFVRDPLTGEATWYSHCSRHRTPALEASIRRTNQQWHINGEPSPGPNAGGVLRRYFDTDWDGLYEWAAPYQKPLAGEKPPTMPKPTLRLIQGGA